MTSAQQAIDHAHSNRETYMAGFHELLSIPSISTDPTYKAEVDRCADWVVAEMQRIGLDNCRKYTTDGHPVVYGDWLHAGEDKPTVVIYAHYDVQPIDPIHLWDSQPFDPTVRDGKLYVRGSADDKCGVWGNLKAIESILAVDGKLPVNIKLFFEGEEEMGSPNMAPFVEAHKDLLKADYLVLCDGEFDQNQPEIGYALRGIVAAEVTVTGPDHDLHSGQYGGGVENPLHVIGRMISSFHDDEGRVAIPGFQDRVVELPIEEKQMLEETWELYGKKVEEGAGIQKFWGESIAPLRERLTALPTLDVNGITGGYQGEGSKTVLPSQGSFKVTMRLVPNQDPKEIAQRFSDYVKSFASATADVQVRVRGEGYPMKMPYDGPLVEAVQQALETTVGKRAIFTRSGGSIPIGGMFQQALGIPITNIGFGAGGNIHSPNEYLILEDYHLALDTTIHFLYNLAEQTA